MKASAADLVAKLSLPLDNGFRLFTKVGIAYFKAGTAPLFVDDASPYFVDDPSRKNVNIVFGLGASYAITPAFSADIAWSFYRGDNQIGDKYIPETDFYTLGLSYKFICS